MEISEFYPLYFHGNLWMAPGMRVQRIEKAATVGKAD